MVKHMHIYIIYIYICICTSMKMFVYIYIYIYLFICIHMCIYTYIHLIYVSVYLHFSSPCIYTQIQMRVYPRMGSAHFYLSTSLCTHLPTHVCNARFSYPVKTKQVLHQRISGFNKCFTPGFQASGRPFRKHS